MIDQEKWIAAQAIMKEIIAACPHKEMTEKRQNWIQEDFRHATNIMEKYALVPEGEEFINTGIEIPRNFWNLPNNEVKNEWLTEWGRTQKVEGKGWYVFCRGKDLAKLKKVFDEREDGFQSMVRSKEEMKI